MGVLLDLMPDIGLGWVGSRGWWGREEHHTHEVLKQRFWLSAYLKYLGAVGWHTHINGIVVLKITCVYSVESQPSIGPWGQFV